MEKINEDNLRPSDLIIEQILPNFLLKEIPLKSSFCFLCPKKETGKILSKLKNLNISLDKVYLYPNEENIFIYDYQRPTLRNEEKKKDPSEFDCSFLKRVKEDPKDNSKNQILIGFIEDLKLRNITKDTLKESFNLKEEDIFIKDIPFIKPISLSQIDQCKNIWPINILMSTKDKYIYNHSLEEENKIKEVFLNLMKEKEYSSYLYDGIGNKILSKGKEDNSKIINHSIINLLDNFSETLKENTKSIHLGIKDKNPPKENTKILFENKKIKDTLEEEENNLISQYYCENFIVLTKEEPCIMCSMALTLNRISRIYFINRNEKDGGLISKLSIDNYNLNHHYLIFQIKIKE